MKPTELRTEIPDGNRVPEAVIRAIADAEGVDPIELEPRLYDAIDPDALENLVRPRSASGGVERVVFEIGNYEVVVEPGEVAVRTGPAGSEERGSIEPAE